MKKIVGILGVAVLAATMFMSTNNVNESGDISLSAVIGLSSANAEGCTTVFARCDARYPSSYSHFSACMYGGGC